MTGASPPAGDHCEGRDHYARDANPRGEPGRSPAGCVGGRSKIRAAPGALTGRGSYVEHRLGLSVGHKRKYEGDRQERERSYRGPRNIHSYREQDAGQSRQLAGVPKDRDPTGSAQSERNGRPQAAEGAVSGHIQIVGSPHTSLSSRFGRLDLSGNIRSYGTEAVETEGRACRSAGARQPGLGDHPGPGSRRGPWPTGATNRA
jgi:hypothetical protein